jgi:hypothetical protein
MMMRPNQVSVERLRLTSDRHYALEQITFRGQDHLAVQTIDPLELTLSREQLRRVALSRDLR